MPLILVTNAAPKKVGSQVKSAQNRIRRNTRLPEVTLQLDKANVSFTSPDDTRQFQLVPKSRKSMEDLLVEVVGLPTNSGDTLHRMKTLLDTFSR